MKTGFEQELKILSTQTDHKAELGVLQAMGMMQDNMCEYYKILGCDGPTMIPKCNCFFVLTKTKIRIFSKPKWLQKINLKTDVSRITNLRMNVFHDITDAMGNLCMDGIQELCPMDTITRKVRPVNTTLFPEGVEVADTPENLAFEKFDEELDKEYLCEKIKININNIDFYGHTNNLEYVKFILSTIPSSEFYAMDIKSFEIHYIHESREREVLDIFCKKSSDNYYYELKNSDKVICKARLVFEKN